MNLEISIADGSEASELTAIAFAAKRHWGYREEWIKLWTDELTVDAAYLKDNWVFVATDDTRIIGWCAVSGEQGEHWLDHCWAVPEATGHGIGRSLVLRVFSLSGELQWLTLKVIADPHAEDFYRRLGFRRIGDHPSIPNGRHLPVLEKVL